MKESYSGNKKILQLIENIENPEDVDINKLLKIFLDGNYWLFKTVEEVNNYEETLRDKLYKRLDVYKSSTPRKAKEKSLSTIRLAIYQKVFGTNNPNLDRYEDVLEYFDEDLQDIFFIIKQIEEIDDPNVLLEIFNECEWAKGFKSIEIRAKREFTRLYNEGLYNPGNEEPLDIDEEILKLDRENLDTQEEKNVEENEVLKKIR